LVADDKPAPGDAGAPADAARADATADGALVTPDAAASPPDTGIPSTPMQPPPSVADAAGSSGPPPLPPGGPPAAQPKSFTGVGIGCALAPSHRVPPAAPVLLLAAFAALIARRRT
jgi:hypothetical protein